MNLIVLTPEKEIYRGQVSSVKVPGINGSFEVLNNHAPLVAALGSGNVRIRDEKGANKNFTISKGFIEVLRNEVSLLVQGVVE
ncbi:MAG: ATP synthase F1 subunit epsilon [Saprospiraceae bacterium]|nr:ATP synthase F1 subunit epsilon [Saprospiraceae bacterium]MCZ2338173.1 ATP synthase F1 subunit epsilon [Chitinophagales bacterium]